MHARRPLHHRVLEPGIGVVILVTGQHRPRLTGMLVGDGHQDLAERKAPGEITNPALLGRRIRDRRGLGTLQTAARTLDQQHAQVSIATVADFSQARLAATGVLTRGQPEPRRQLPAVAEVARLTHAGDERVGGERTHARTKASGPNFECVHVFKQDSQLTWQRALNAFASRALFGIGGQPLDAEKPVPSLVSGRDWLERMVAPRLHPELQVRLGRCVTSLLAAAWQGPSHPLRLFEPNQAVLAAFEASWKTASGAAH